MKTFVDSRTFQSKDEIEWSELRNIKLSELSPVRVAESPILYIDRRAMAQVIAKTKIFEMSKNIQGSIVECGVYRGNSIMLYSHLCSIFCPVAFNKKIIGFDTFEGFAGISNKDPEGIRTGDLNDVDYDELCEWITVQQENNFISHIPRIELVRGLAEATIPRYVNENPHLLISLLYMDFDLFSPTITALEHFYPLMPRGAIIAFDQLNQKKWAGETIAFKKFFKAHDLKLMTFDFEPHISYAVVGE
jgi:hypothetical protein